MYQAVFTCVAPAFYYTVLTTNQSNRAYAAFAGGRLMELSFIWGTSKGMSVI